MSSVFHLSSSSSSSSPPSSSFGSSTDNNTLGRDELSAGLFVVEAVKQPNGTEQPSMLFVDMMADLQHITSKIESVKKQVRVRRQRRAAQSIAGATGIDQVTATGDTRAALRASSTRQKTSAASERKVKSEPEPKVLWVTTTTAKANDGPGKAAKLVKAIARSESGSGSSGSSSTTNSRRKKDDDALDCIYAELQESVGMCRYWGKKCWNLRVPKVKGGFHSLCHFHRVKANDNQRRFDYKRRGTMWRSFKPDPNYRDISLFPGVGGSGESTEMQNGSTASFEPFESPVPLQDQDVALLRELIGATTI